MPRIVHGVPKELREIVWKFVVKHGPDEHWEWTGRRDKFGPCMYVTIKDCKEGLHPHRMVYESFHSTLLSDNHYVFRTCSRKHCMNPAHMALRDMKGVQFGPVKTVYKSPGYIRPEFFRLIRKENE